VPIREIRDLRGSAFMVPRGWRPAEDWTETDSTEVDTPGAVQAHPDPYAMQEAKVSPQDTASVPLRFVKTEARRAARAHTVIRLPPTSR
jgi:hypothetical protein